MAAGRGCPSRLGAHGTGIPTPGFRSEVETSRAAAGSLPGRLRSLGFQGVGRSRRSFGQIAEAGMLSFASSSDASQSRCGRVRDLQREGLRGARFPAGLESTPLNRPPHLTTVHPRLPQGTSTARYTRSGFCGESKSSQKDGDDSSLRVPTGTHVPCGSLDASIR